MKAAPLKVDRLPQRLVSDDARVIARVFHPGNPERIRAVIRRVMALPESQVETLLAGVLTDFAARHRDIESIFAEHYETIRPHVRDNGISRRRLLLMGAYFTMEYAIESAALFNPSIVRSPVQNGLPPGTTRFLMSLRATGEGHISSIVFRSGVIDRDNQIHLDKLSRYTQRLKVVGDRLYDNHTYRLKLIEMGSHNELAKATLARLSDQFIYSDLEGAIGEVRDSIDKPGDMEQTATSMLWLARSNYHLEVPPNVDASEIVIFPSSENESRGIEDVRLVRFVEDDGSACYYGTYTAYNGLCVLPQLIETTDFHTVQVHTLNGRHVQNKGLALFPRRVNGWYTMVSRLDGENLYLMKSDNIRFWNDAKLMQAPRFPWEFVQIGNCGSPLETDAGWLLLTHGVGPMRRYCIGASLLDHDDPSRVIGQLSEPLLTANDSERDGYVPNVVYTCGAMIHNDTLIIPYAISDSATTFATVAIPELLAQLCSGSSSGTRRTYATSNGKP
jgi:predicted GH43/DUF377 family glycosyl hydrolase